MLQPTITLCFMLWEQFMEGCFLFYHDSAPLLRVSSIKAWLVCKNLTAPHRALTSNPLKTFEIAIQGLLSTSVFDLTNALLDSHRHPPTSCRKSFLKSGSCSICKRGGTSC